MPYEAPATLRDSLLQPELRAAYRAHVTAEFSPENLDFHEAVEGYRKMAADPKTTPQELNNKADQIYNTYVDKTADKQVNLSTDQFKSVDAVRRNPGATAEQKSKMFDVADKGIMDLMSRDSFARFKRGDLYKDAVKGVGDEVTRDEARMVQLKARQKQLETPSLGDRMKAAFATGGIEKVKADNAKEIADLQKKLDDRAQKAPSNNVDMGDIAPKVVTPQAKVPQVLPPTPKVVASEGVEAQAEELGDEAPKVQGPKAEPRGPQRPPPPRPDAVKPEGVKPDDDKGLEQEQEELDGQEVDAHDVDDNKLDGQEVEGLETEGQEVDGIGMENMDEIGVGEGRSRSNAVDEGRPRSQSVREALGGKVGAPKQGADLGPKVGKGGVK